MDNAQNAQVFNERIAELEAEVARLRALEKQVEGWLLTLEQEHEKASHGDENTRQISSKTCHVCAGIDAIWFAIRARHASMKKAPRKTPREERSRIIREAGKKDRKVLDRLRDHDQKP